MYLILLAGVLLAAPVPHTAPSGDLNGDGMVDVLDLQCEVLLFHAVEGAGKPGADLCADDAWCVANQGPDHVCRVGFDGFKLCLPGCLHEEVTLGESPLVQCTDPDSETDECLGLSQKLNADMNCDGVMGNEDFTFLVAVVSLKDNWPGGPDADTDGRLNGCDDDSDGDTLGDEQEGEVDSDQDGTPDYLDLDSDADGVPDEEDCQPTDPQVGAAAPEVCDKLDNDCNGQVDDGFGELLCGQGICTHPVSLCLDGQPEVCNPFLGAQAEVCDNKDNDCDGFKDEEGALGCTWYHADADSDGWGDDLDKKCLCAADSVYKVLTGGDCYDDNWLAKPYQQGWYKTHRGDGSFDYNCDGSQTPFWPDVSGCSYSCPMVSIGWLYFIPPCGSKAALCTNCTEFMGICQYYTSAITMECH